MDEQEVQNEINDLRKAIDSLKKEFGKEVTSLKKSFEKDMATLESKVEDVKVQSRDTYMKAQEAKHEAGNVKSDLVAFIRLFEKNQVTIEQNQDSIASNQASIQDLLTSRKSDGEKVNRIVSWFEKFMELATMEGWKNLFVENSANTEHRKMQLSWKQLAINVSVIAGAILMAIALAKAIGLFK